MRKTTFEVPTMDCTGEEHLIRMALFGVPGVRRIDADLSARHVTVVHEGTADEVLTALRPLNLNARLLSTDEPSELDAVPTPTWAEEARTLKIVLSLNATMCAAEALGAILADSSALLADSLDMFADAAVYGIALFGVHNARATQMKAARISGVFQVLLALGALAEVVRRAVSGSEPDAAFMVVVALAALAVNVGCMWLLARHRHGGAHMKASWIFTTNDVIANIGVIVAAGLVRLLNSNVPDLIVATVISFVVLNGAVRILRLRG